MEPSSIAGATIASHESRRAGAAIGPPPPARPRPRLARGRPLALLLLALLAALLRPAPARGHVVYERTTLAQFASDAALILVGVVQGGETLARSPATGYRTPAATVRVEKVLKGKWEAPRVTFVGYRAGVPRHPPGGRGLFFLVPIAKNAVMKERKLGKAYRWFTYQAPSQAFPVEGEEGAALVAGVERLVTIQALPGEKRVAALRGMLVAFAGSRSAALRADVLNELVNLGDPGRILRGEDAARLERAQAAAAVPVPERVALVTVLSQMPGYDAAGKLLGLLGAARTVDDRVVVLRVLSGYDDPRVGGRLRGLVDDPEPRVRAEVLSGLAGRAGGKDVPVLLRGTRDPDAGVRRAAVKALGRDGGPEARAALLEISARNPDRNIRRWAGAELRILDARRAASAPRVDRKQETR